MCHETYVDLYICSNTPVGICLYAVCVRICYTTIRSDTIRLFAICIELYVVIDHRDMYLVHVVEIVTTYMYKPINKLSAQIGCNYMQ